MGATGPAGPAGAKHAIVPSYEEDKYVALVCVEQPEARFEDILVINPMASRRMSIEIDKEYLNTVEHNSVQAISYTTDIPCSCGIKVLENTIYIEVEGNIPQQIVVKISGIRKGFTERFKPYTKKEMDNNTRFWDSWKKHE